MGKKVKKSLIIIAVIFGIIKKLLIIIAVAFGIILVIFLVYNGIINSQLENIREDLDKISSESRSIEEKVVLGAYSPIEAITKLRELEKEMHYLEIKGNKILESNGGGTRELLHDLSVNEAKWRIESSRLEAGVKVVRNAGLVISPELVQKALSELDQSIRFIE